LVKSGRCAKHIRVARDPGVKRLYNSARWQALREAQLGKDPWCADCLGLGKHVFATEVDHIQPHRGNPILFFDPDNLQSLCKPHHSGKTASEVLNV
jgi:5-methylcytosine-specific restriction enzyme A